MTENVYKTLANHLNALPAGYPPTESGVELRILRRLFSEEQARLAVHLTMNPEPAAAIAQRAGLELNVCQQQLDELEKKGLTFTLAPAGETLYMAVQFVVGFWEYSVNSLRNNFV